MKALVVEEQARIRMNTVRVLAHEGYEVAEAGNGEDAIALLDADSRCDAILMDIDLGPGRMDGTRAVAEMDRLCPALVAFYSCHVDRKTICGNGLHGRYVAVNQSTCEILSNRLFSGIVRVSIRRRRSCRCSVASARSGSSASVLASKTKVT